MGGDFATVLIEPNTLCREGLAALLSTTRFQPIERVATLDQFDGLFLPPERELFFVVDLGTDAETAAQGIRRLKERYPTCCVLVLTEQYTEQHMWTVLRAGADGYLMKSASSEILLKSLDLLALGEPVVPSAILATLSKDGSRMEGNRGQTARPLSGREAEILRHLSRGDSNKAIARQLDITEATVKVHIKAILRKIQVKNRTQAAVWALDRAGSSPRAATIETGVHAEVKVGAL